jgi:hypothetical protein
VVVHINKYVGSTTDPNTNTNTADQHAEYMCILCDDSQLHGYHHGPLSNTIVLCKSSLLNLFRLKLTGYEPGGSVVVITVVITLARISGSCPVFG